MCPSCRTPQWVGQQGNTTVRPGRTHRQNHPSAIIRKDQLVKLLRLYLARSWWCWWMPALYEWESDPFDCLWRRLISDGSWEYKTMTDNEVLNELSNRAW